MQFSLYSLGLIAALTGLAHALPTGTTPSLGDLTSSGTAGTSGLPELPELPSSTADSDSQSGSGSQSGSQSGSGASNINGGNFMGLALGNDIDLGNLEKLPKVSTDVIVGSLQHFGSTQVGQQQSDNGKDSN
ncbi:uncharacterized protein BDV17DRAFT_93226 [Aspergillus undulatus]|uniref:uncharacterized protein n=1 Tax=Aspergillus undulatus TaxID=1810928 RepID=UPI003CCE250B